MKKIYPDELLKELENDAGIERELKEYWKTLCKEEQNAINEQAKDESIKKHGKRIGSLELSVKIFKLELLAKHKFGR